MEPIPHLTSREVAEILGVNPTYLTFLRSRGKGPAFTRIGPRGHPRYHPDDVASYLAAHRSDPERQLDPAGMS